MKFKKIIILFFCALIVVLALTACENKTEASSTSMFTVVEERPYQKIVVDNKTFVMYAVSMGHYNGGNFTMLVDKDENPRIYK